MNRSRASAFVEVSVLTLAGKLCCKAKLLNKLRGRGDFAPIAGKAPRSSQSPASPT